MICLEAAYCFQALKQNLSCFVKLLPFFAKTAQIPFVNQSKLYLKELTSYWTCLWGVKAKDCGRGFEPTSTERINLLKATSSMLRKCQWSMA